MELIEKFEIAAQAIQNAGALVITAGAGMGVDSGLPDFRGHQGFWNAYPAYERLGMSFISAANPSHFEADPAFGWGFYGHRTNLYRSTIPHQGFNLLLQWISNYNLDYFVVTSNVDGQFQKAGFSEEKTWEAHGSIHHLQCVKPCGTNIWSNKEDVPVDESTMLAGRIPECPRCGATARPNILMFGDYSWLSKRSDDQEDKFQNFLNGHRQDLLVVIEMGAGTAISTIRNLGERLGSSRRALVVRINPREPEISKPHLSIACGALEGLTGIQEALSKDSDS
ncbi:MAG TPA: NAD-dependent deacetylase [Desulfotomaculum sp.]|nr:MAG: NAD-dependent protein deacetylase [Desulfotomaculum sp. 46_80]HAG10866.1 NAD-dependent deacetylase [Desulfotomaculum sp.]HBY03054.1 NAD-dependent deacetylase [Desulfotomaculum sp.]